MAGYAFG